MAEDSSRPVGRRSFLAVIGAAGAASVAAATTKPADATAPPTVPPLSPSAATEYAAIESAPIDVGATDALHVSNPGSDYMVQCLRDLQYEYVAAMPGSTFRGLQESVINYLGNSRPEWITCVHEEISGALAHGYAKASGKPMAIMVHNTIGLQHASMAIYQAWADRVPMLVMLGNYADAAMRTAGAEWYHSEVDNATMVRGYIKYDDQPGSVQHFAESIRRGHGLMTTPPMGPALIVADQTLQEVPLNYKPVSRPFVPVSPPSADANAIEAVAQLLVGAQAPVIVVDRAARTPAGVRSLIALAELLQAPVVDRHGRMNFPTNHYLNGSDAQIERADVILALEVGDLYSVVNFIVDDIARTSRRVAR